MILILCFGISGTNRFISIRYSDHSTFFLSYSSEYKTTSNIRCILTHEEKNSQKLVEYLEWFLFDEIGPRFPSDKHYFIHVRRSYDFRIVLPIDWKLCTYAHKTLFFLNSTFELCLLNSIKLYNLIGWLLYKWARIYIYILCCRLILLIECIFFQFSIFDHKTTVCCCCFSCCLWYIQWYGV